MTITHPHHPLRGQRVTIVRIRHGADPDLLVQLLDGTHTALAMSATDYAGPATPPESPLHLLALDGLRQVVHLLEQLRQQGRFPTSSSPPTPELRGNTAYDERR